MVCFTDKCDGLRYIPILNLKSYYEETKRKNNINVGIVLPTTVASGKVRFDSIRSTKRDGSVNHISFVPRQ